MDLQILKESYEEAIDTAIEMSELVGELNSLYVRLEELGYSDYKIKQELGEGYMGDTLRNYIDELSENIDRALEELED